MTMSPTRSSAGELVMAHRCKHCRGLITLDTSTAAWVGEHGNHHCSNGWLDHEPDLTQDPQWSWGSPPVSKTKE